VSGAVPALPPRAVLFDLDGTLIHSAPDLAGAVNTLLMQRGLKALDLSSVVAMIGNGIRKLVERAFTARGIALSGDDLDAAYDEMMRVYGGRLVDETVLYPGAREVLAALAAARVPMALVTNKPQALTERIIVHFDIAAHFGAVVGGDLGIERKPAPDMLLAALERLGADAQAAFMVGDSKADAISARAAGLGLVMVRGGYTTSPVESFEADLVADTLMDLPRLLQLPSA